MDGTGGNHVKQGKPSSKSQISHFCSHEEYKHKMMTIMIIIIIITKEYDFKRGTVLVGENKKITL
jgi:sulfate adenylyltransferase subunit 1 (EFTu-like GTPase family)